jgi:hypothetical protein
MAFFMAYPRKTVLCCVLAATAVVTTGCPGPPPPPEYPTPERVSVSARSIGIRYGPVILLRNREQLIAIRVVAAPTAGYTIEYEWKTAEVSSSGFVTDDSGTGTTEEERGFGVVKAGPVRFKWSRASRDAGFLYWPQGSKDLSVCSVTWASVDGIDLHNPKIHWYSRDMF